MNVAGRRFVLSQSFLYSYGGSEVVTLELAEHLSARGAEVLVVVHGHDEVMSGQITGLPGVRVLRTTDEDLEAVLGERPVDIAWVHQQLVPEPLLRQPGETTFVFSHLSSVHPLEFPFAHRIEAGLASAVVFPSDGARDAQVASGLLDAVPADRLHVSGNPSPDTFADVRREHPALERLLVVSNHIPAEVAEAIGALREHCEVVVIGLEQEHGGVQRRVDPALLAEADAVLTIGKTVQYAIQAGVPVYCYDHFGGPGWLDEDSVDLAERMHFSGKGFTHKSAAEIVREVLDGYATAAQQAVRFADVRAPRYSLAAFVDRTLAAAAAAPRAGDLDEADVEAHLRTQSSLGTFMVMAFELDAARRWLVGQNAGLTEAVAELRAGDERLRDEVARLSAAEAELPLAAAREAEVGAAFREARAWAAKTESDLVELQTALADAEQREVEAGDAARRAATDAAEQRDRADRLAVELEAARAEHAALGATRVVRGAQALGLLRVR